MLTLVAVLFAVAGGVLRARRRRPERTLAAALAAAATLTGVAAVIAPGVAPVSWGVATGIGIVLWRNLDPRWEPVWWVTAGTVVGFGTAAGGWLVVAGAVGTLGVAALVAPWAGLGTLGGPAVGARRSRLPLRWHVFVCVGGPCQARGAARVLRALARHPGARLVRGVRVSGVSCLGRCQDGPICWVEPAGTLYTHVEAPDVEVLAAHVLGAAGGDSSLDAR
jgi:(2Fe-2S) ferredoxin